MKDSTLYAIWAVACFVVCMILGSISTQGGQVSLDVIKNICLTIMIGNLFYLTFGYISHLKSENE